MSQELKTKFTADASDFNGAVKQIEGRLKGVGKIGAGLGVGNVTGGIGNFLGGLGSLGFVGGGAAGLGLGVAKVFQNISQTLEDREKAIAEGMPVRDLTSFGRYLKKVNDGLDQSGRVFSGIGVLLTQGLDAYQDFVTGESQKAQERYAAAVTDAAEAKKREAESVRAQTEANERLEAHLRRFREEQLSGVEKAQMRESNFKSSLENYKSDTIVGALEKSGNPLAAEAIRLSRQFNETLGLTGAWNQFTPEQVLREYGSMIQDRLATGGSASAGIQTDKISEVLQQSPELTDRLRRIGAAGGDFPSQTTQVFREMRSLAQQSLDTQKQIAENTKDGAVTLR